MKKVLRLGLVPVILTVILAACAGCGKDEQNTGPLSDSGKTAGTVAVLEPVAVETFQNTFTYDNIPRRVVSLDYEASQIMVALGLEDHIVSVATAEGEVMDCLKEYQDALSKLKIICRGTPTFEVLLESDPDFIFGTVYSFTEHGVAPSKDFVDRGLKYYALRGTYVENACVADTYKDIENIGKIFRVGDRAERLVGELKEREARCRENIPKGEPIRVMAYDSGEKAAAVAGRGIETDMIEIAGGKNIFDDIEHQFGRASWEQVALRNPEIIVIHDYNEGETRGTLEDKIGFLCSHPALQEVDAIKNRQFVPVKLTEVFPGLQTFDAIEKLQGAILDYRTAKK